MNSQVSDPVKSSKLTQNGAHMGESNLQKPTSTRRAMFRWVLGLAVGIGAIWVVASAAGGFADAAHALSRTRLAWVMLAVGIESISYIAVGFQLRRLASSSMSLPRRTGVGLALIIAGFGLLTPASPVEGLAIASRELRRRGATQRQAVLTLGFGQWFYGRMFLLIAAVNLVVAVALGDLAAHDVAPFLAVAAIGIVILLVTARMARKPETAEHAAVLLGRIQFWRPNLSTGEQRVAGVAWHSQAMAVVGSPANRLMLAALTAAAILADMAALWASLVATGVHVRGDVAVLAASAGVVVTLIPLLPGGLGLVEAVMPAVLHHFGAPLTASLAGALIYRAVGTFLPAAVGAGVVGRFTLAHRVKHLKAPT